MKYSVWSLQNKEPRDWQNLFAFTRFRLIEVLFHAYILLLLGEENQSLCRGLRYIEVHYIILYYHCNNTELVIVPLNLYRKLITRLKAVSFCPITEGKEELNVKGAVSRLIYRVFSVS